MTAQASVVISCTLSGTQLPSSSLRRTKTASICDSAVALSMAMDRSPVPVRSVEPWGCSTLVPEREAREGQDLVSPAGLLIPEVLWGTVRTVGNTRTPENEKNEDH